MAQRYAVYFAPDAGSALEDFGHRWFGRNGASRPTDGPPAIPQVRPERVRALIEGPRRYGFHGTLKPPFELNPASSESALLEAARIFARSLSPIEIPPLELAVIGKFIALTPVTSSAPLELLAAKCVRAFEGFRVPLTEEQAAYYQRNKLTVHQDQMLEHWGYPYVMEEFRFHISLTERIDDIAERNAIMQVATALAKPVVGKSILVRDIVVFGQKGRKDPMVAIERIPFGRST
jgi:putative phosphonate metabolism protein